MKHIGISGPIASGKSTLSKGLSSIFKLLGHESVVIPFATGVKYLGSLGTKESALLIAFDYFQQLGYDEHRSLRGALALMNAYRLHPVKDGEKPRALLQYIGTEVGRNVIDPLIWIKEVSMQKNAVSPSVQYVISDDVRFVNESHAVDIHIAIELQSNKAQAFYEIQKKLYAADYLGHGHASEQERSLLRKPDYIIDAYHTVEDVLKLIRSIMSDSI